MRKLTNDQAISKVRKVHGDTYSFAKFEYKGAREKVVLVCEKHGEFCGRVNDFARGSGCPACGVDRQKCLVSKSFETFLADATKVHGDKYEYDESTYVKYNHHLNIRCKEHGWFRQMANTHTYGSGCPHCQINGFNKDKAATVYLLSSKEGLVKVGITNRKLSERLREINKTSGKEFKVVNTLCCSGEYAFMAENEMLSELASYQYSGDTFSGYTETFSSDCFDIAVSSFVAFKMLYNNK